MYNSKSLAFITLVAVSLVSAQDAPIDSYQKVGNEVGNVFNSIGNTLHEGTADAAYYRLAVKQADTAISNLRNEIRSTDWSYLGPQGSKQHIDNMEGYLRNLEIEKARYQVLANQAAQEEANLAQAKPSIVYQQVNPAAITGRPVLQYNAVIKEESRTTDAISSAIKSVDQKESKAEEKSLSKESKSESKEAKKTEKAAKSEIKAASTSQGNNKTSSTASKSSATHSKNSGIAAGVSTGALALAVFAMI